LVAHVGHYGITADGIVKRKLIRGLVLVEYATAEHAWQACKYSILRKDAAYAEVVRQAPTAKDAKQLGGRKSYLAWRFKRDKHVASAERGWATKAELETLINGEHAKLVAPHEDTLMMTILTHKFQDNADLGRALVMTGSARLCERDFRGRSSKWSTGGGNLLGILLMRVRAQLAATPASTPTAAAAAAHS
jgi:predicted NAD-dependent protein-ADP-ribosyltransferase YbiA (DUF1768 family)